MRRLPVYLLLDISGSMKGEPIKAVNVGIQMLVSALRQDPYALETAYLSVITFESSAKQVIPLTELVAFQLPSLKAGGETALGDALALPTDCIEREIIKTTAAVKGDWKPLVFLMTDGRPGDAWKRKLERLKQAKIGMIVACAAGQAANIAILKQITEHVVRLGTAIPTPSRHFSNGSRYRFRPVARKWTPARRKCQGLVIYPRHRRESV